MTKLAGFSLRNIGYQPRHRSPRRDYAEAGWLSQLPAEDPSPEEYGDSSVRSQLGGGFGDVADTSTETGTSADAPEQASESAEPDVLDQLTSGQLRRILEGCAINDVTKITPEIVTLIAHSSHSAATLAGAWRDFQQATRDSYELHLGRRAWWEFFDGQDLGPFPEIQAVEIKLREADDAWSLITNGECP
jgi:hypothetical protein